MWQPYSAARRHSGYGTLHENCEARHHPARFDDAICVYPAFNSNAAQVSALGPIRLVARLTPWHEIAFPELVQTGCRFKLSEEESVLGVFTDHIEPLPDGRVALSVWNTAQQVLQDYYLRILAADGTPGPIIREVEKRARFSFSDLLGQLVVIGETTSQLFDVSGARVAHVDNPPRSKAVFRRWRLQGIWNALGTVFLPSPIEQNNTVLVMPEPDGLSGAAYLQHIHQAVLDHDRWVRKQHKTFEPMDYRWRE